MWAVGSVALGHCKNSTSETRSICRFASGISVWLQVTRWLRTLRCRATTRDCSENRLSFLTPFRASALSNRQWTIFKDSIFRSSPSLRLLFCLSWDLVDLLVCRGKQQSRNRLAFEVCSCEIEWLFAAAFPVGYTKTGTKAKWLHQQMIAAQSVASVAQ